MYSHPPLGSFLALETDKQGDGDDSTPPRQRSPRSEHYYIVVYRTILYYSI